MRKLNKIDFIRWIDETHIELKDGGKWYGSETSSERLVRGDSQGRFFIILNKIEYELDADIVALNPYKKGKTREELKIKELEDEVLKLRKLKNICEFKLSNLELKCNKIQQINKSKKTDEEYINEIEDLMKENKSLIEKCARKNMLEIKENKININCDDVIEKLKKELRNKNTKDLINKLYELKQFYEPQLIKLEEKNIEISEMIKELLEDIEQLERNNYDISEKKIKLEEKNKIIEEKNNELIESVSNLEIENYNLNEKLKLLIEKHSKEVEKNKILEEKSLNYKKLKKHLKLFLED